jgi:hypothetical protein
VTAFHVLRSISFPSNNSEGDKAIQSHGVLERVLLADKFLDVHKYPFLQHREGRDERPDLFHREVNDGFADFCNRFQKMFFTSKDMAHLDQRVLRGAIDALLSFNGWVAAACLTLRRPFGQNSRDDHYEDLASVAIVIHSADPSYSIN